MGEEALFSSHDVLHFVAIRDPQRPTAPIPKVVAALPTPRSYVPTLGGSKSRRLPRLFRRPYQPAVELVAGDSVEDIEPPTITKIEETSPVIQAVDEYLRRDGRKSADAIRKVILNNSNPKANSLSQVVASEVYKNERTTITQSLLSVTYGTDFPLSARTDLVRIMQVYAVIDAIVADPSSTESHLAAAEKSLVLVPVAKTKPRRPSQLLLQGEEHPTSSAELLAKVTSLESAADELAALLEKPLPEPNVISGWDEAEDVPVWVLRGGHQLSESTRKALQEVTSQPHPSIPDVVEVLRKRAERVYQTAVQMESNKPAMQTTALIRELNRVHPLRESGKLPVITSSGAVLSAPPRIGDLEVITTETMYYKPSDIAHIENILSGETKERTHQVVDVLEEMSRSENETIRSVAQRSQSLALDELGSQVNKLVQEDSGLEAALSTDVHAPYVEISANVGFSRSTSKTDSETQTLSYAHQKLQEASVSVSRLNREVRTVIERTEITETNKHQLTNKTKKNISGVYCWLDKHQRAQVHNYGSRLLLELLLPDPAVYYRYARAKGAGLRVDVEAPPDLVMPLTGEPLSPEKITRSTWLGLSARFKTAELSPPPPEFTVSLTSFSNQAPPATAPSSSASAASPYPHLYRDEQRAEIPSGYQALQWVAVALLGGTPAVLTSDVQRALLKDAIKAGSNIPSLFSVWGGVVSEDAKKAWDAWVDKLSISNVPNGPTGSIAVGPSYKELVAGANRVEGWMGWGTIVPTAMPEPGYRDDTSVIPVALQTSNANGYAITVTILNRISSAYREWQVSCYKAILEKHQRWERDFRSAVSQSEFDYDRMFEGENPRLVEDTILEEIKHVARKFLGYPALSTNGVDIGDPHVGREPDIDAVTAAQSGPHSLFYETAFDWKRAMYHLYPYMHSTRRDWTAAVAETASDPLMRRFLRAGSVRVVLPVTEGYERAVCARLALDLPEPWISDNAVTALEEPWISIVEEIRRSQDVKYKRIALGPSWEFDVATTLVRLEDDPALFQPR